MVCELLLLSTCMCPTHSCAVFLQLACCCGSAACSLCCGCCPKIKQSTSTRFMYALFFMLVTVTCVIMMSPTVETAMREHVSLFRASPFAFFSIRFPNLQRPLNLASGQQHPVISPAAGHLPSCKKRSSSSQTQIFLQHTFILSVLLGQKYAEHWPTDLNDYNSLLS